MIRPRHRCWLGRPKRWGLHLETGRAHPLSHPRRATRGQSPARPGTAGHQDHRSQSEVLRILDDHGQLSLTGIGELLVCESGRNPSRRVDRLVGEGLVERVVAAEDRRRVTVSLTSTGREMEAAVRTVEKRLYLDLDTAAAGLDLGPALKILRALSAGQPAGNALERRVDALRTHDNLPGAL